MGTQIELNINFKKKKNLVFFFIFLVYQLICNCFRVDTCHFSHVFCLYLRIFYQLSKMDDELIQFSCFKKKIENIPFPNTVFYAFHSFLRIFTKFYEFLRIFTYFTHFYAFLRNFTHFTHFLRILLIFTHFTHLLQLFAREVYHLARKFL